jgi:hypothetical protein
MKIEEKMLNKPKKYSKEEIQSLIDGAHLEPVMGGREGPFWCQRVYFYTDYDNDDVKTLPWLDDLEKLDIILLGLD